MKRRTKAEEQVQREIDARESAETGELMARLDIARGEEILSDDDDTDSGDNVWDSAEEEATLLQTHQ